MAHFVGSTPSTTSAKAALAADREALLEQIRFEVLDPKGASGWWISQKLDALKALDALDDVRQANDRRISELVKLAGSVHDRTISAGYEVLADELKAANTARSGAGRAQALFDQLARQCRNLHAQIDDAAGDTYTMKVDKAAGNARWLALAADHRAVTIRTKALTVAVPDTAAKAADYRRRAAAVTDPILRAGYEALAAELDSSNPKG